MTKMKIGLKLHTFHCINAAVQMGMYACSRTHEYQQATNFSWWSLTYSRVGIPTLMRGLTLSLCSSSAITILWILFTAGVVFANGDGHHTVSDILFSFEHTLLPVFVIVAIILTGWYVVKKGDAYG